MEAAPLPSCASADPTGSSQIAGQPALPRQPFPLNDVRLSDTPLPYRVSETTPTLPWERFFAIVRGNLIGAGFVTAYRRDPKFAHHWWSGHGARTIDGLLIAERRLSMDVDRQRAAVRQSIVLALAGLALFAFAGILFWLGLVSFEVGFFVIGFVAVLPLALAAGRYGASSVFNSDVVCVRYITEIPPGPLAGSADATTPLEFGVTVTSGRIVTRNWQSRYGSGRSFLALLPDRGDLPTIPSAIVRGLTAGDPVGPPLAPGAVLP